MHNNSFRQTNTSKGATGVLAALRALLPNRHLTFDEAMSIAELQAERLLRLRTRSDVPVPVEIVTDLPRILIDYDNELPRHAASGASNWDTSRRCWVIRLNEEEPLTRQRFTVLHEFKHIVDHYHPGLGGQLPATVYGLSPVEYIAEYFAGCVLMPKRLVKAAYYDSIQRPSDLAELFDVSPRAMEVRLTQLGIVKPSDAGGQGHGYRMQPRTHYLRRPVRLHAARRTAPQHKNEDITV